MNLSANALNNGLLKINNWTYHWKMSFNSDPSKQAQEVIFSQKIKRSSVKSLHESLESLQYNASLAITGAIEVLQRKNFTQN